MASSGRRRLKIIAVLTVLAAIGWFAAGLVFRYTAYGSMPVAPGEPYGEADVLELVHYGVLLMLSGLSVVQALVLLVLCSRSSTARSTAGLQALPARRHTPGLNQLESP